MTRKRERRLSAALKVYIRICRAEKYYRYDSIMTRKRERRLFAALKVYIRICRAEKYCRFDGIMTRKRERRLSARPKGVYKNIPRGKILPF